MKFLNDAQFVVDPFNSVMFGVNCNGNKIRCFITIDALNDHFKGDGCGDYVALYKTHKSAIDLKVEKLIQQNMAVNGDLIITTKYF